MKQILSILCCLLFTCLLASCERRKEDSLTIQSQPIPQTIETESDSEETEETMTKMKVQIGETAFTATLESNKAAEEFIHFMQEAPVVISMKEYSGFEKVGELFMRLTADNRQMTTQSGDIVLYNGNQIVIFYGSNSWSYTKLGKIDNLDGWEEALGSGDIQVEFSVLNEEGRL